MWCQNLHKGDYSTCKALMLMSDIVQLVVLFMQLSTTVLIVSAFSLTVSDFCKETCLATLWRLMEDQ